LNISKQALKEFIKYYKTVKAGNFRTVFVPTFSGKTQTFPKDLQAGTVIPYAHNAT